MSETGHHSSAQPAEQHGENLLQEPRQEEAQVRLLHICVHNCIHALTATYTTQINTDPHRPRGAPGKSELK